LLDNFTDRYIVGYPISRILFAKYLDPATMNSQPSRRPTICSALTSLTLGLVGMVLSSEVEAGCNHRVTTADHHRLESSLVTTRLSLLAESGSLATFGGSPGSSLPDRPCSGPSCSERSFPSEAPARLNLVQDRDWGLGSLSPEIAQRDSLPRFHVSSVLTPIHVSTSIERPPRGR
jgi:hypothetical protein